MINRRINKVYFDIISKHKKCKPISDWNIALRIKKRKKESFVDCNIKNHNKICCLPKLSCRYLEFVDNEIWSKPAFTTCGWLKWVTY